MAPECPECGVICHCNGDIDDCLNNFEDDQNRCTHYLECERDQEDYEDYEEETE